jgi:hypothetical protein
VVQRRERRAIFRAMVVLNGLVQAAGRRAGDKLCDDNRRRVIAIQGPPKRLACHHFGAAVSLSVPRIAMS